MMSKARHSEFPWTVERTELDGGKYHEPSWGLSIYSGNELVCDLYEHDGGHYERFDRDEANARLIAACPLMLDYIAQRARDGDGEAERLLAFIS
jgi:hypothetical protein